MTAVTLPPAPERLQEILDLLPKALGFSLPKDTDNTNLVPRLETALRTVKATKAIQKREQAAVERAVARKQAAEAERRSSQPPHQDRRPHGAGIAMSVSNNMNQHVEPISEYEILVTQEEVDAGLIDPSRFELSDDEARAQAETWLKGEVVEQKKPTLRVVPGQPQFQLDEDDETVAVQRAKDWFNPWKTVQG